MAGPGRNIIYAEEGYMPVGDILIFQPVPPLLYIRVKLKISILPFSNMVSLGRHQ